MKYGVPGILLMLVLLFASCTKDEFGDRTVEGVHSGQIVGSNRLPSQESRKVLMLYLAAYNNISDYIANNLDTLQRHYLPGNGRNDDVVLVCSKFPERPGNYSTSSAPVIFRLYADQKGNPVRDTLYRFPEGTLVVSSKTLNAALTFAKEEFRAASYGLLFSSHATGWLPPGYYNGKHAEERALSVPLCYRPESDEDFPMVKSLGQETNYDGKDYKSYEMSIHMFAEAIPMKLDYFIIDACLAGGIEIAYELKDKVDYLLASQTEILADGIQYNTLLERLFQGDRPDLTGICEDYYHCYANKTSAVERSATISLVNCKRLGSLQKVCATLFEKYRSQIHTLSPYQVQGFFTRNKHWFFDLKDILVKAGISSEEEGQLNAALKECIEYEAHTEEFLQRFPIRNSCGLSMYLPSGGEEILNRYYQNLAWNKATGLVR